MDGAGSRDLGVFNYWGNETDQFHGKSPSLGSGVMFINSTQRAVDVMIAWAEAMANDANTEAPDDQVLNKLLNEGAWLARASYGYLPASYMRTMPWFYRGVNAVIDHDHGSSPGVGGHSEATPTLPQILPADEDGDAAKKSNCLMHGICDAAIQKKIDDESAERKWREDKAAGLEVGPEPMPVDPNEPLHFPKAGNDAAKQGTNPSTGAPIPEAPQAAQRPEAPAAAEAPATQDSTSGKVGGKCKAVSEAASDEWCENACNAADPLCPEAMCECK